jgi:hypothetical protein
MNLFSHQINHGNKYLTSSHILCLLTNVNIKNKTINSTINIKPIHIIFSSNQEESNWSPPNKMKTEEEQSKVKL